MTIADIPTPTLERKRAAMATETDLWQTAWIIAERYGAEGVGFAAEMAHSFRIGGKFDAHEAWRSITQKVETLTAAARSNDAAA
jgi:hypothetical protein